MEEKKSTKKTVELVEPDSKLKSSHCLNEAIKDSTIGRMLADSKLRSFELKAPQAPDRKPDPRLSSSEIKHETIQQRQTDPRLVSDVMKFEIIRKKPKSSK